MKKISDYLNPCLEITTVMGCRVNCKFCPQKVLLKAYYSEDSTRSNRMTFDTFKICINKMPKRTTIIFSGASEPMLNYEVYDMILYAHSKGFKIRLLTTLEGMSLEGVAMIQDIPFQTVVLHAPDIEGYAAINMNNTYFEILDKIMKKCKENGSRFVDSCNCQGTFHPDFLSHVIGEIPGVNQKTKLHDRAGNIKYDEKLDTRKLKGKIICGGSFPILNHFMLMPDGTVCLCCMDFGMKHVLGNLLIDSYRELRASSELKRVERNMRLNGAEDILCRNCSYSRCFADLVLKKNK